MSPTLHRDQLPAWPTSPHQPRLAGKAGAYMDGTGGKLGLGRVVSELGLLVVLSGEASGVVLLVLSEVVSAVVLSVMTSSVV